MYDQKFWNERYATKEYLYGREANSFLTENVDLLGGPVFALSEGEGRNAVFMASRGLSVLGVDCSEVGLEKAKSLAKSRGVVIETEVADLAEFTYPAQFATSYIRLSKKPSNQMASCCLRPTLRINWQETRAGPKTLI